MDVQQVLRMNGGERETSYANNSVLQKTVISKVKPIIEETIVNLLCSTFPKYLMIADLGCSSGPNTLGVISDIIDITDTLCRSLKRWPPGFQAFLNDLPGNDFNTIFTSLPAYYERLKKTKGDDFGPCFIAGVPGSFYGRLFPSENLHFVHSSYSLHWLSRVPQGLETEEGTPLNKGNLYIQKSSPPSVLKAYWEQFQRDFFLFLRSRSEEIIPGGRMVLTFLGRKSDDPSDDENCTPWKLLSLVLNDMILEGLVEEAKLDSFHAPFYAASAKEIRSLVKSEGSFNVDRLETFEVDWEGNVQENDDKREYMLVDKFIRGQNVAKCIRAVSESLLGSHFGEKILDDLFCRFKEKVIQLPAEDEAKYLNVVISMTKKG